MYLIIDTTGQEVLVALGADKKALRFSSWENGYDLSQKIQVEVEKVVGEHKKDLQAIFCVTGPGSFTGIRVGVSVANALAFALDIPVVAVTAFEIFEKDLNPEKDRIVLLPNIHDLVYAKVVQKHETKYYVGDIETLLKNYNIENFKITGLLLDKGKLTKLEGVDNLSLEQKDFVPEKKAKILYELGINLLRSYPNKKFTLPLTPLYVNKPNITKPKSKD